MVKRGITIMDLQHGKLPSSWLKKIQLLSNHWEKFHYLIWSYIGGEHQQAGRGLRLTNPNMIEIDSNLEFSSWQLLKDALPAGMAAYNLEFMAVATFNEKRKAPCYLF